MQKKFSVRGLRWWMLLFFVLVMLFNYIDRASLSIALSLITSDFGINEAAAGILSSAFFWSYTLMQIPGGMLVKKFKPRKTVSIAIIGWGIVQALTAVASSLNVFVIFRVLLGIFESPVQNGMNTATLTWLRKDERGRGSTIIDSGGPLGSAIGSILVTGLIVWLGTWRAAFIFLGAITLLIGVLAWSFIRNSPSDHPWITPDEANYLDEAIAEEVEQEKTVSEAQTVASKPALTRLAPWMLLIAFAAYDAVQYGLLTWAPYYISKSLGISFGITGVASMFVYLGGFAGEMVVGQLSDHWLKRGGTPNKVMRTLFVLAGIGVTVCTLLVNVVASVVVAIVLLTIANFFTRWGGLYWSVPQQIVHRAEVPTLSAAMNFAGNAAGIAIPIIVGFIASATGSFTGVFILFGVCGIIMALSSAILNYESGPTQSVLAAQDKPAVAK